MVAGVHTWVPHSPGCSNPRLQSHAHSPSPRRPRPARHRDRASQAAGPAGCRAAAADATPITGPKPYTTRGDRAEGNVLHRRTALSVPAV